MLLLEEDEDELDVSLDDEELPDRELLLDDELSELELSFDDELLLEFVLPLVVTGDVRSTIGRCDDVDCAEA